jgi:PhnB protein
MQIQPYLFFNGRCDEAIEFYRGALGAEVEMILRMKEGPDGGPTDLPPGWENKVMHASIRVQGNAIMMSDAMSQEAPRFEGFALSLNVPDAATADRFFAGLAEGGQVTQPLVETFFSPRFGMVSDRFGVHWMVNVVTP